MGRRIKFKIVLAGIVQSQTGLRNTLLRERGGDGGGGGGVGPREREQEVEGQG